MARWSKLLLVPFAGVAAGLVHVLRIAHRPDLPAFPNLDLSGTFGDPSLPPLRIVAVGDSNLTAPGVAHPDEAWLRRAVRTVAQRHRVELHSLGRGGARTRQVRDGQLLTALALAPDVAVVAAGGNDTLRVMPRWLFRRQLNDIVGPLHETAAGVVVLGIGDLGAIPRLPWWLRRFLSWRSKALHESVKRVVDRYPRAALIETWGIISDALRERGPEMFADDLFHPSGTGHAVFMDEVLPAFEEALGHHARLGP